MNQNTYLANSYKVFVTLIFSIAIYSLTFGQTRPSQNIRWVTVTTQYVVVDGTNKGESYPINQEIYDSLGRCHTEIDFGFKDHYAHNYRWHTFNGTQKVKSEIFENEKLKRIRVFSYTKDSLLAQETIKTVKPGDTSLYLNLYFKYNQNKKPIQVEAKTATGKTAYISKSTYNEKGKELTRKVRVKKNFFPEDSILNLVSVPVYDSLGRLKSELLTKIKTNKTVSKKTIKYTFNNRNQLVGTVEVDVNGSQIGREEREYQNSKGRLTLIRYFDKNNVLINMFGKRYEIYRSNERRDREQEY
ncbi:MAG: hypothetical protein AB9846_05865 [Tenuifilaceae bacterium]